MINLLPPYWQKKLEEEELFKIVATMGMFFALAAAVFVLMLVLVRIYCLVELEGARVAAEEKQKEIGIMDIATTENEITSKNRFIAGVSDFYAGQILVTEMVELVAKALPEGTSLSELSLAGNTVHLGGYSPDRNSLVALKSNLEKEASFKEIVFPPENWLMAQDIYFSINLKYEP